MIEHLSLGALLRFGTEGFITPMRAEAKQSDRFAVLLDYKSLCWCARRVCL